MPRIAQLRPKRGPQPGDIPATTPPSPTIPRGRPARAVVIEGLAHYRRIPIERIILEGINVRAEQDTDHVIELANSIAKHGLLNPITVVLDGDRYRLVAGLHRTLACRRLGHEEIDAHIKSAAPNAPSTSLSIIENIIRKDLTLEEECTAICHLHNVENLSPNQICDLVGKSKNWVSQRLLAPSLPEDVRTALFEGAIGLTHANLLGNITDDGIRGDLLWRTLSQRWPAKVLEGVLEAYLQTPSITEAVETGLAAAQEIKDTPRRNIQCEACHTARHYTDIIYVPLCRGGCEGNATPDAPAHSTNDTHDTKKPL